MRQFYKGCGLKGRVLGLLSFFTITFLMVFELNLTSRIGPIIIHGDPFKFNYKTLTPNYTKWSDIPSQLKFTSPLIWNNISICHHLYSCNWNKTIAIIINSARSNFHHRNLQRTTWGSIKYYKGWSIIAINFLLGQKLPNEDPSIEQRLEDERKQFGDLILGDFQDTYRNLTLKTIMGYEWLMEYCPNVKAVIKGDDDVVIYIHQMINLLITNPSYLESSNYYGDVHADLGDIGPIRNPQDRWFVSKKDYPGELYPTYVSGFGQLMTIKVIEKVLVELRQFQRIISMDDIMLSGIVPQSYNLRLNNNKRSQVIKRVHINGTWEFPQGQFKALRNWYNDLSENDYNYSNSEYDHTLPIFYIIPHGKVFKKDFSKVWNKLKIIEGI